MLHAFIDESETRNRYFTLAALIVTDENLPVLNHALADLVAGYALTTSYIALNAELHGYDIMQQQCDWSKMPLKMASSIYLKALGIINQHASALYVETIDRQTQSQKYTNPWNPRKVAIGYILERVNGYATLKNEKVQCYLDDHYTAPEGRKEFVEYKANGTFGYRSSRLPNIKELDFYDSRTNRALQAADLCCYIYQRRLNVKTGPQKLLKTQQKMWGAISPIALAGRQRIWP